MEVFIMNKKELDCRGMLELVKNKSLSLVKASEQCGKSYRQMKRLYQRYCLEGEKGLTHKNRGRPSNRCHPERKKIIERYKEKYEGFGPTLASEKLSEEEGMTVNHETLRRWLLKENLWHKARERSPYRKRRERRAQFGELLQIDGSIHDWFQEGKHTCLINIVDDATGKTMSRMDAGETTRSVMALLKRWIESYGIPLAIYVDLKNVYVSSKKSNERKNASCVEKACRKLNIKIIKAYSPQAKGRVERNHGVYQDRFVKELHLKGIKTIAEANSILENYFIEKLNKKFEKSPRNPSSAHRPIGIIDLDQVFCWEDLRVLQQDWTFSYGGKYFQVEKPFSAKVRPNAIIAVRKHLSGEKSYWCGDERLCIKTLDIKTKLGFISPYPTLRTTSNKSQSVHSRQPAHAYFPRHS